MHDVGNSGAEVSWWRHQMETFFMLLALCVGNSPVTGEFPSQKPVTRSLDFFFDLRLNKRLSKQSWAWWFETPSRSLWRHGNVIRVHPGYGLSQWEEALICNALSYWSSPYSEWSLITLPSQHRQIIKRQIWFQCFLKRFQLVNLIVAHWLLLASVRCVTRSSI